MAQLSRLETHPHSSSSRQQACVGRRGDHGRIGIGEHTRKQVFYDFRCNRWPSTRSLDDQSSSGLSISAIGPRQKGKAHIERGFKEAGVLDCFGVGGRALYQKALDMNEAGTLFPGGKNTNIDASIDSTVADLPEDVPENVVPYESNESHETDAQQQREDNREKSVCRMAAVLGSMLGSLL